MLPSYVRSQAALLYGLPWPLMLPTSLSPAAAAPGRSLMPARHVAETLQRHQRDAELARGRQVEEAGAAAVIDSAHQEDQGDSPPHPDSSPEADDAEPADTVTQGSRDGSSELRTPAEVPAGLARIRTAAANATSALLGVRRAVGGAIGTTKAGAKPAEEDREADETKGGASNAGAHI